jgi:hypothetical protein
VGDQLLEQGINFADTNFLPRLPDHIKNKSMTGFIIEHAVLSSIRLNGLAIRKDIRAGMMLKHIRGASDVKTDIVNKPVLYRPIASNHKTIDGMIVLIKSIEPTKKEKKEKPKLLMVPFQITIAASHKDSHAAFVTEYNTWARGLSEFDVELEFVWITPEQKSDKEHDAVWTHPKQRDVAKPKAEPTLICPKHIERHVPLQDVDLEIWQHYQRALAVAE